MSANSTPIPYIAAADSNLGSGFEPWRAFNGNFDGATDRWIKNGTGGWLSMDFGSGIVINGYRVTGTTTQTVNPRNWTFEGSNNNSTWTVLHTVTNGAGISGMYQATNIGNVTSYRYYRINISLNGGGTQLGISEFELYTGTAGSIAAGGSFNFNTAGVVATIGSVSYVSTSSFTVTNTTGLVTISILSSTTANVNVNALTYSGNGNLDLTVPNIYGGGGVSNGTFLNKTGSGTLNFYGNLFGAISTVTPNNSYPFIIAAGTTNIYGNVTGGSANASNVFGVSHTGGNLNVFGNVIGGTLNASNHGINSTGGSLSITGNLINTGSALAVNAFISFTVNGNVIANFAAAISTTNNITVTVNGNVYASALANAINLTTGTVYLKGNMYDVLGRVAIYCPNIFIDNTSVSLWEMSVGGGLTKKLYSADTTPNLPVVGNVRDGITYGPASSLTGTMKVPSPSNVRTGVPTDNTVGSATALEAQDIINYISSSSDDLAKRLRRILTTEEAGNLIKNN